MKNTQTLAKFTLVICLFLAMATVVSLGIPFFNLSSVFSLNENNVSKDFSGSYEVEFSAMDSETLAILEARIDALPYNDVSFEKNEQNTFTLSLPRSLGASANAIAETLTMRGVFTYTDVNGKEMIPSDAIAGAQVGYGIMDPSSPTGTFYIEFFLKDKYRTQFEEATEALSHRSEDEENILHVKLDGADVLQARVTEKMTEETFRIGGEYADATLLNLYASFINSGSLKTPPSFETPVAEDAKFNFTAYVLFWGALLLTVLVISLVTFAFYKVFSLPTFSTLLFYLFSSSLFFQIFKVRISPYSFLGVFISLMLTFVVLLFFINAYRKELGEDKPLTTAIKMGNRAAMPRYFILHFAWILLSAGFIIFSDKLSQIALDLATVLLFLSVYSLVFTFASLAFYNSIFRELKLDKEHFKIQ